jgi:cytochrome c peroxidase
MFMAAWGVALVAIGAAAWLAFAPRTPSPGQDTPAPPAETAETSFVVDEPIQPVPHLPVDRAKAALGKRLFHDPILSDDQTLACASCHDLAKGGADGRPRSEGAGGLTEVNTPTVFNSRFNFRQFWDGRAESLEEQIDGPLLNKVEMATDWEAVLARLSARSEYRSEFASVYPDGITRDNVRDAIATFERALVTPDSRFDRYLRGDRSILSAEEVAGYELFKDIGCVTCHQGVNVGGNMFQTFGRMGDYFADRGNVGSYNVTGQERDRFKFKVPGLRNVALTAPYFHDAQAQTLEEAVEIMARYQLGHDLEDRETAQLVAFLETLTGEFVEIP